MLKERYYSLDVFRGATVALMILVNNPGSWEHIFSPLEHAGWHGCTPTDLVFPFFLFAVGNAMAFVMPRLEAAGASAFWRKLTKRFLLIFLIGMFLNWSPFVRYDANNILQFKGWINPDSADGGIRILGVLQRIAIAYLFASILIYYTKPKATIIWCVGILLGYWALLYFSNPADPYSLAGFMGTEIDKSLFGIRHIYKGEGVPFDPEGLVSSLPAIVQVVLGYFAGRYIIQKGKTWDMLATILIAGILLAVVGMTWGLVFPLNKKIWTSSYVLYTTGLAVLTIGVFIYLLEFKNKKGAWSSFFDVFGKNPLFIFVLSGFVPRVQGLIRWSAGVNADGKAIFYTPFSWFYKNLCAPVSADPRMGSLLYALVTITVYWFIAWLLHRKKIYIKV